MTRSGLTLTGRPGTQHAHETDVLAIDPGPLTSGVVTLARCASPEFPFEVLSFDKELPNDAVLDMIQAAAAIGRPTVVENLSCYGRMFSIDLRDTCYTVGKILHLTALYEKPACLITRPDVKLHVTGSRATGDPQVRDALIEHWGGEAKAIGYLKIHGTKNRTPKGPLYGISSHAWAALALATTYLET